MNISRLYTGADGQTHMEWMDLESHPELATLQKAEGIQFRSTPSGHFIDWHPAPRRQFVITISGEVEIGLGDGSVHRYRRPRASSSARRPAATSSTGIRRRGASSSSRYRGRSRSAWAMAACTA